VLTPTAPRPASGFKTAAARSCCCRDHQRNAAPVRQGVPSAAPAHAATAGHRTRSYRVALMPESEVDQRIAPAYTKYAEPGDHHPGCRRRHPDPLARTCCPSRGGIAAGRGRRADRGPPGRLDLLEEPGPARGGDRRRIACPLADAERRRKLHRRPAAQRITSVPGASDYFLGGFLHLLPIAMKTELLGVPEDVLREHTR